MPKLTMPQDANSDTVTHRPQVGEIWEYVHPDFGIGPQLVLEVAVWDTTPGRPDQYQCQTLDIGRDVTEKVVFCYSTNPFWQRLA